MTRANVQISVSSDGTVKVKKDIEGIGESAREASQSMDLLKGILATVISTQTFRAFADITSQFTDYKSRVDLATDGTINATDAMEELYRISQDTYSTFDQTAETFLRNSTALSSLGVSTQDVMTYTEALNSALVVSGAKGDEAARAMEALSKGMMTGKLEAEGLKTVMNSSSRVAELLAKEIGVNVSELMKFENRSKITGQVIYNSLVGNISILRKELEEMPTTINDGIMRIVNAFRFLIGSTDDAVGASQWLASHLVWVADNLKMVLIAISPLAAALTILGVQIIGTMMVNAFFAFTNAIVGAGKALTGLYTLIMANPIVAIGVAIAAVIVYFVGWEKIIENLIAAFGRLVQVIGSFFDAMGWTTGLAEKGFQIYVNAKQAAADLKEAVEKGATRLAVGVDAGSQSGANKLKKGVEDGAAVAARMLKEAQERAVARYEDMNGKHVKELGNVLTDGGNYMYNQVTGAVTKAGGDMQSSIEKGGQSAGASAKSAIEDGGETAAYDIGHSMKSAGQDAASSFEIAGMKVAGELAWAMETQIKYLMQSQNALIQAQTALAKAQMNALDRGNSSNPGFKGTGSSGSNVIDGGSGFTGKVTTISTRDIHYDNRKRMEEQRKLDEAAYNARWGIGQDNKPQTSGGSSSRTQTSGGGGGSSGGVAINNYIDPNAMVNAMDTAQGREVITNIIKTDRNEFRKILGY